MNVPSFCLKYKVLKPHPAIVSLSKAFRPVPNSSYELAETSQGSVRKYRGQCASMQNLLHVAEWRHEAGSPIARYLFLQLVKPNRETRGMQYEAYVEHMQVCLQDLGKLIAQESFYLLREAARGYLELFSKFKKAAVNSKTIGLNSQGRCIVWLHDDLSSFLPPPDGVSNQLGAICGIVEEVRKRSEPFCQGILGRLMEDARRRQLTLSGFIEHVTNLANSMKITLPNDLRYLVNQHRILIDVKNLKERVESKQSKKQKSYEVKPQRYRPLKIEAKQNLFSATQAKPFKRAHRMSNADILEFSRVGSSFQSRKLLTQKNITRKKQSYISTNMSSFIANSDKKLTIRNHSKCTDEEDSHKHPFSKSRERTVISKCKSSQGRYHTDINLICARPFERLVFEEKDTIEGLQQQKSFTEYGHNSQFSDRAYSFRQKQQKKPQTGKVYRSFIIQLGCKTDLKNKCIGQACEQYESSPNKQKVSEQEQSEDCVSRSGENLGVRVQDVLRANHWTKALDSHQLWVQSKLNTSITLGQERSTYLEDIKLQRLEMLSRQMAVSRLPDEIYQPLVSQTYID